MEREKMIKTFLVSLFLLIVTPIANAEYFKLPDGSYVEIDKKWTKADYPFLYCRAYISYPQAFYNLPPDACNQSYERIKQYFIDKESGKAPQLIPLPTGEWYENKKSLLGKALYCDAYKNNQSAFLYDEQVTALCKSSLMNISLGDAFSNALVAIGIRVLIAVFVFFIITYGILKIPKKTPISNGRFVGAIFVSLSLISFPSIGKSQQDFYFGITLVTCFWFIVGFAVGYIWRFIKNKKGKGSNDLYWDNALKEFESANRVSSLWAKCFADSNGDENKAKALYIKLRVAQMEETGN